MLEEKGRGLAAWVRNVYILVYYIGALLFLEFFNLRNLCVEIFVEVVNFGIATRTNSRRDFRLALLCLSFSLLLLFSFRLLFFLVIYAVAFCNTICLWLLLFLLSLYEYELLGWVLAAASGHLFPHAISLPRTAPFSLFAVATPNTRSPFRNLCTHKLKARREGEMGKNKKSSTQKINKRKAAKKWKTWLHFYSHCSSCDITECRPSRGK